MSRTTELVDDPIDHGQPGSTLAPCKGRVRFVLEPKLSGRGFGQIPVRHPVGQEDQATIGLEHRLGNLQDPEAATAGPGHLSFRLVRSPQESDQFPCSDITSPVEPAEVRERFRLEPGVEHLGCSARLTRLDPLGQIFTGEGLDGGDPPRYYSRGFTLSCCLRELSSGRFSIRSYGG